MFKNTRGFTSEMFRNPCVKMFVGTTHVTSSTTRASKLVDNKGFETIRKWILSREIITNFRNSKHYSNFILTFAQLFKQFQDFSFSYVRKFSYNGSLMYRISETLSLLSLFTDNFLSKYVLICLSTNLSGNRLRER